MKWKGNFTTVQGECFFLSFIHEQLQQHFAENLKTKVQWQTMSAQTEKQNLKQLKMH